MKLDMYTKVLAGLALLLSALFAVWIVSWSVWILGLIGLALGVLAITDKEKLTFLVVGLVFAVISGPAFFLTLPQLGLPLETFLSNLFALTAPATILTAIWVWLKLNVKA